MSLFVVKYDFCLLQVPKKKKKGNLFLFRRRDDSASKYFHTTNSSKPKVQSTKWLCCFFLFFFGWARRHICVYAPEYACVVCVCVCVCVFVCVIVVTVYHYFWVVEVWHSGWESCGRHSQKSGFLPKRECKQSIWMDTGHTRTHTHSLSLILPADPLIILGTAWHEKREEIHNEY